MAYEHLTKEETYLWKFLNEKNMNSNPDKWKEGYKEFIRYCKEKIPYSKFEDMLINFRNYYLCISFDYNFDTKKFIISLYQILINLNLLIQSRSDRLLNIYG